MGLFLRLISSSKKLKSGRHTSPGDLRAFSRSDNIHIRHRHIHKEKRKVVQWTKLQLLYKCCLRGELPLMTTTGAQGTLAFRAFSMKAFSARKLIYFNPNHHFTLNLPKRDFLAYSPAE